MPEVSTEAMQTYLNAFAATIAEGEHVPMVLDQAGWHGAKALKNPRLRQPRVAAATLA
jgi:hypothetical protein